MVEGKAHPCQSVPLYFEDLGVKTVGLLLSMMKSYFATGRYLILDSGLFVFEGLIQLRKKVFFYAVIKKKRYCPYVDPGKYMENRFGEVEVGDTYDIQGTVGDVIYNLWEMKEPNYVMRMMDTDGCLLVYDTHKETVRIWNENGEDVVKKFKYNMTFYWNFLYPHAVDDHNNRRHALPSIEDTWVTDRWTCRLFAFFLTISEVNSF